MPRREYLQMDKTRAVLHLLQVGRRTVTGRGTTRAEAVRQHWRNSEVGRCRAGFCVARWPLAAAYQMQPPLADRLAKSANASCPC